jgi:hypothetical protein
MLYAKRRFNKGKAMRHIFKWAVVITGIAALAACGGGGGSSSPSTASTSDYQLRQAWVNYVMQSDSRSFVISGSINAVPVTGSGTATQSSLSASSFEGRPALIKSMTVTGSFTGAGQTFPYGSTSSGYFDSNYLPMGASGQEYIVVTGTPTIPQIAKVNDTGTLYVANRYTTSQKSSSVGTVTVSYVLQADTADTALLKVISTEKTTLGTTESTAIGTYRVTPAGGLTKLKEEYQQGSAALTLTY